MFVHYFGAPLTPPPSQNSEVMDFLFNPYQGALKQNCEHSAKIANRLSENCEQTELWTNGHCRFWTNIGGPKTHPKSGNTKKTPRPRELFREIRANFCLLPCDTSQEPNGNCSEKLVQMNFFILGGLFLGGFLVDRFLSSAGAGGNCARPMRLPDPSPVLDKNRAPISPEILSNTGAGVWRKAPMAFPDCNSVLDKFQSTNFPPVKHFSPNSRSVFWRLGWSPRAKSVVLDTRWQDASVQSFKLRLSQKAFFAKGFFAKGFLSMPRT